MHRTLATFALGLFLCAGFARGQDINAANEKAMKAATVKVAPSVVRIDTVGGLEIVGGGKSPEIRTGTGGTTGVVVSPDGYIITSSFNFASKPSKIFVTIPGRKDRLEASEVATDQTRMLTLIKVDATGLTVPTPIAKKDTTAGQWALAIGRTLDPDVEHLPSVSLGIISAKDRIWGKVIQTDAKVSPTNYGGPLIGIDGRVFGILVPMGQRGSKETIGYDWYDSGISFAVPFEDVLAKFPAMKAGNELRAGLHGIVPKNPAAEYLYKLEVGALQPKSAAEKAGIEVGDVIASIDGKPVPNYSTFRHIMEPKYEGDSVTFKVMRGDKELEFKDVKLLGASTAFINGFLGILPLRDDPGPGVPIRFVYPDSPAAKASLKEGDRIMKLGPPSPAGAPPRPARPLANRDALATTLASMAPGDEVQIEVKRKDGDKIETITLKLGTIPDVIPAKLPMPSSAGKAMEGQPKAKGLDPFGMGDKKDPAQKVETGYIERANTAKDRSFWLYIPSNYDPNISHGLIVWFHGIGQGGKDGEARSQLLKQFCEDHHFIVMGPRSASTDSWIPTETQGVVQDIRAIMKEFTIDHSRVIAHGTGNGGQMAFHVGFNARDTFRGVAPIGAKLGTTPGDNIATQPLSFFIATGDKDPNVKEIEALKPLLAEKGFPVVVRVVKEAGKDTLDAKTFEELQSWMDSLDRL